MEGLKIVAVHKDWEGRKIEDVKLSNGEIVSMQKAVKMCNSGLIPDYITATRWDGYEYLRTRPNQTRGDNLRNLPEF